MHEGHRLSIWFFVGFLLTVYGIIILTANIQALFSPVKNAHVVLENLHSGIWWGALLILLGILFLIIHWPWKRHSSDENKK
jgi:hypothetical protein